MPDYPSLTYSSETLFQVSTPGPSPVTGRFIYRYYEPGEGEDENLLWVERYYTGTDEKVRKFHVKGSPRYIDLSFDYPSSDLASRESEVLTEYLEQKLSDITDSEINLIVGQDIFSEYDIQKNGYIGVDFNPQYQTEVMMSKAVSPEQSIFDAFMNTASNTSGADLSLTDTSNIDPSTSVVEIEPSTNQEIVKSSGRIPDLSMPALVNDDFIYDIFKASSINTCLAYESQIEPLLSDMKTKQQSARLSNQVDLIDLADSDVLSDVKPFLKIDDPSYGDLVYDGDYSMIGHVIFKYRKNSDGTEEFIEAYLTRDQTFRDYRVAYGRSYSYVCHSVIAYVLNSYNRSDDEIYLFYSGECTRLNITCVENVSPNPPAALNFSYDRGVLSLSWRSSHQITEGSDGIGRLTRIAVNDIKGYQVFCRNSLQDPYQIKAYYHFHDGDYPQYAEENIPATIKIKRDYEVLQHEMSIESNRDYYFSMCSIDAHGNSSAYSEQIYVYHDKITGKLTTKLVSESGAPKAYPNMYYKTSIFKDSISSSYHNNLEIIYHPDVSSLAAVSSGDTPVYSVQMIDVSSMSDQIINMIVKETSST